MMFTKRNKGKTGSMQTEEGHGSKEEWCWGRYGATPNIVLRMRHHPNFIEMLDWRASVFTLLGEALYFKSNFHQVFRKSIRSSPLEKHYRDYRKCGVVDVTAVGNYFDIDSEAVAAHEKMREEYEHEAAAAKRKRMEEKKKQKELQRIMDKRNFNESITIIRPRYQKEQVHLRNDVSGFNQP
ncbi:hypothetical protein BDZ45DRAFT_749588 [Acephala macrosclerotiorum]|nr:hypothetical protein BDZ45DRAFT_749588 [Acephala macrosclerotiorum]